jgi:hypothetical protein
MEELLNEILNEADRLIISMEKGVCQYLQIISRLDTSNQPIANDILFRQLYRTFFAVLRKPEWLTQYLSILDRYRDAVLAPGFTQVLQEIYERLVHKGHHQVEKSYASKLVHVLNRNSPIIDKNVINLLHNRGILFKPNDRFNLAPNQRFNIWGSYFNQLSNVLNTSINFITWHNLQERFDDHFLNAIHIQPQKKLDFFLWRFGA